MSDDGNARRSWIWIVYAVLILLRLYIASRDEIIPYWADSANYAAGVMHDTWFQDQRSGVSWVASIVREFGIPYKLALDTLYVSLCVAASRRVFRLVGSEGLALLIFFLLAFASYFFRASVIFCSDPLTACIILAATLVFSRFFDFPVSGWRWRDGCLGGMVLGLWSLTRPEDVMILGGIALLAVGLFLFNRYHWRAGWSWRAFIFLLPLFIMGASDTAVRLHNLHRHHLAVQSRTYGPGATALLNALYSIPPDREVRYCPVPRTTFQAAATVSPTLKPLLPQLTDTQSLFYLYSSSYYKIPDEVSGWLNFLLPQVYGEAYSINDGSADRAMMRTAQEIRDAQAKGQLGRRWSYFPVDPVWQSWLPDLPRALLWATWNSLGLHFGVLSLEYEDDLRSSKLALTDERNFSDGLLLRTSLNERNQLDVSGTLPPVGIQSQAASVLVRTDDGIVGASPVYPYTDFAHPARFNIVAYAPHDAAQVEIEFWDRDHLLDHASLAVPGTQDIRLAGKDEMWTVVTRHDALQPSTAKKLELAFLRVNDLVLVLGLAACIALAARHAFRHPDVKLLYLATVLITAVSFILPRILLYALLYVWMKWDALRYFAASSPAALFALLLTGIGIGSWIGVAMRRSRGKEGRA